MREAVVVLAPDVGGQQVVERGDRRAPRDAPGYLQPLGVLVEHRVDDVDEGLVAREEAVPSGEQIALEPALAGVLAQDLHHPAVGCRGARPRAAARPSRRARSPRRARPSRFEAVSSGPNDPEVALLLVAPHDVAQEARRGPASPRAITAPGRGDIDGVIAEVRQAQILEQEAAVGVRVGAHAPGAGRRQRRELGRSRPRRRTAPPGGSSASTLELRAGAPAWSPSSASGTWCERQVPSVFLPSTRGPVQPFGVASTIIGQRGRRVGRRLRAAAGSPGSPRRSRRAPPPSPGASAPGRRPPRSTAGSRSRSGELSSSSRPIRARIVGLAIL